MYTYVGSILLLILSYLFYSKYLERNFGVDNRLTPAVELNDGVDYVEMHWFKAFLIQFLNIAGLGPVTGAIAGALWGPVSYIWIIFGCIFIGSVHDYYSGMISMRDGGKSIPELIELYLGKIMRRISEYIIIILLIIVGIAFLTGPAELLANITTVKKEYWIGLIALYYLAATILPIDKIIGKFYPIFGGALIIMVILLMGSLIVKGYRLPEIQFKNLHPKGTAIFPFLFVVISCGAVSGFHSTQSVLMGRCIKTEFCGRKAFYGAMVVESAIALTWAAISISFFGSTENLLSSGGGMIAIGKISSTLLGGFGVIFTILGIVVLPITTGDTAFRSARLTIADKLNLEQKSLKNRFYISIPLFALALFFSRLGFSTLWRYIAVTNQLIASLTLWMITFYLIKYKKNYLVTAIPAGFMTGIMFIYLLMAPEGLKNIPNFPNIFYTGNFPYYMGIFVGVFTILIFELKNKKIKYNSF